METKVIEFVVPGESKFDKFKRNLKYKLKDAKDWVINNKETLVVAVPAAIGGISTITKVVGKSVNNHQEKQMKDRYIYDRSLGRYVELKRKLNQKDLANISKRKQNGERVTDILLDMNLVK